MKKIAVIGTGIMGSGIAKNYLEKGIEVVVWNRSKDKADKLIDAGAIFANTPREATEKADIVFEVTANDESSRSVWMGDDGILAGAKPESILISSATLSVSWVDELAKECLNRNVAYFDIPMTGGRAGAESGQLIFLAGGDEALLRKLEIDLAPVCKQVLYFGKAGMGTRYKLLLNMLQAIHIIGLGEVLKIAKRAGMDMQKVGDALAERPGGIPTAIAWRDYQADPNPINFSIAWIAKDLAYAKNFAADLATPLLDDVLRRYREAIEDGHADDDWTKVNKIS